MTSCVSHTQFSTISYVQVRGFQLLLCHTFDFWLLICRKLLFFRILANLFRPHLLFVQLKCHIWGLGAVQNSHFESGRIHLSALFTAANTHIHCACTHQQQPCPHEHQGSHHHQQLLQRATCQQDISIRSLHLRRIARRRMKKRATRRVTKLLVWGSRHLSPLPVNQISMLLLQLLH
jgi:hypothetical protein